jgi:hypothetical protein
VGARVYVLSYLRSRRGSRLASGSIGAGVGQQGEPTHGSQLLLGGRAIGS